MKYPFASIFARNILSRAIASTAIAGAMTLAPNVYAQETSAIVRGAVSTSSGEPMTVAPAKGSPLLARSAPVAENPWRGQPSW